MEYDFREIEKKWRATWAENKTFSASDDQSKPKYYVLDMFPYPSGAGLHVGHPLGYIASDIYARYKRLQGFNVLHPMGYDSFGLPAEQYAIQTGQHPEKTTRENIARYRDQLDKIGFSFDWDREVRTSDPTYYKWTQWIFIQLFNSWYNPRSNKAEKIETLIAIFEKEGFSGTSHDILTGDIEKDLLPFTAAEWKNFDEKKQHEVLMNFRLTYLGEAYVNWCPALGTVLANDEVKDGFSERGGHPVERKLMKQWSMRITAYAQRLLEGLDTIDWSESIKEAQRNWIGRSEGASLKFKIENPNFKTETFIEVFTTRPDTVFGVSFVTLAPEHELVSEITTADQKAAVEAYVTKSKNRSERERMADVAHISGVFTGSYVTHPFNGKQIPIWVGDYVLAGYGTGAVMAVPAHDERDYKFAKHFGLNITQVIEPTREHDFEKDAWAEKEGKLINSDFLNGLDVKSAIKKAIAEIDSRGFGNKQVNFRLRDAVFGRQRYWGEPIPVFYKNGTPYVLPENELPLTLPEVDKYLPTEDGEPPLARANNWKYKDQYEYEHSTMPGWAGSSWYFLRYMDPANTAAFADTQKMAYWKQVDLYIGGSEHATGHLLYARFWTKFLYDCGYIGFDEPFKKLINQGMILGNSAYVHVVLPQTQGHIPFTLSAHQHQGAHEEIIKIEEKFPGAQIAARKVLLIPEEIYHDIKKNGSNKQVDEWFKKQFASFGNDMIGSYSSGNAIRTAIDVSLPEGDKLKDLDKLREWHRQYEYAELLVEGDYKVTREVEKMSKSKFNVQTPDELVEKFGADTLRLYEMFLGPLEQAKPWDTQGINGVHNFLRRFWRLFHNDKNEFALSDAEPEKASLKTLHKTIKKIQDDLERFSFNTGVSNFMIATNEFTDQKCNNRAVLREMVILLSSYAPHIAEELWHKMGEKGSVTYASFPTFNPEFLVESAFEYPVSFNGKMRFKLELPLALTAADIEKEVLANEHTAKYLEGKTPKKVIIVHGKIVNIVM